MLKVHICIASVIVAFIAVVGTVHAVELADANIDGKVDGGDYGVWLNNFGNQTQSGVVEGDFNNDKEVDGVDYIIWLINFNSNPSEPLPTVEPTIEPSPSPQPTSAPTLEPVSTPSETILPQAT